VTRTLLLLLVQTPLAAAVTVAFAVAAIAVSLVDRTGRSARWIGGAWGRAILGIVRVRVGVAGVEHVPSGPAVYAANHGSALDILIVFGYLPVDFRIIHKRSLYRVPFLGWTLWLAGHVAIDRLHPFRARRSLDAAARRIRSGTSVVVFPEGTRSPDRTVRRFKRGPFTLALEAGAPVVPVSLVGVKDVAPRTLLSVRPGRVDILIHPPVPVAGRSLEDADALAEQVRAVVAAGLVSG
jgi:1-acyl-sn-glycerol-3-phosphate acyltransferase